MGILSAIKPGLLQVKVNLWCKLTSATLETDSFHDLKGFYGELSGEINELFIYLLFI